MLERRSMYYLNKKDREAIVYEDANGNITRLTISDFASKEEFLQWKSWSDCDFHTEERRDHIYDDNNLSLEGMSESVAQGPSAEIVLERKAKNRAREHYNAEAISIIRSHLTPKQFRRVWLYYVYGLSEKQIAKIEKTTQQSISDSIRRSVNKLKTFQGSDKNAL